MTLRRAQLAAMIDHTLLAPTASDGDVRALVAEAIIREAIVFMEGFRDDSGQTDVVAILDNLEDLARTLKGGAA